MFVLKPNNQTSNNAVEPTPTITLTPSPTPSVLSAYTLPVIPRKDVYKIAMLGDSMTAALGPHGGGMSEYMNKLYKSDKDTQRIIIDNYAVSSNILAIDNQISQKVTKEGNTLGPLLSQEFDVILIESFGYNPLSEFGIDEGLKKQTEALEELTEKLVSENPKTVIIFVATIAPNILSYGQSTQPDSNAETRKKLAEERIAYIKNHIEFAKKHNIPLVNVYEKSLTANGDGNVIYINPNDDIHPSFQGIDFIGHEIGDFIFENKILPL